ncbi:MAG: hypothetical protein QOI92_2780 [Chloroflexota bacterium]|nr:hypothetical protein [Chloroflexota bacterium]
MATIAGVTRRSALRYRGLLAAAGAVIVVAAMWSIGGLDPAVQPSSPAGGTRLAPMPGSSVAFDVRQLPQLSSKTGHDRDKVHEKEDPEGNHLVGTPAFADIGAGIGGPSVPAPSTDTSFDGLAYTDTCGTSQCGDGHPPDTNGDVGPTYYIEVVNTAIGIFNKSTGSRVAAFTFDSFMSQGNFGNLCDTDNFGDPVVLYDTFQDRWFITDFAFQVDGSGNIVNPPGSYQCIAVSKTGDPVSGGWNYYSIHVTDGLPDYPKFGIWPDGIYMSANVFDFAAGGSYQNVRVWALDKAKMYAGQPASVITFDAPATVGSGQNQCAIFTLLPSNARAQTGTPPAGRPNMFTSTWCYANAIMVFKFHVDWATPANSTFTAPTTALTSTSWALGPDLVPAKNGNDLDTLGHRGMVQNQYSNLNGVESLWDSHTVAGVDGTQAAVRWYQLPVTGGTIGSALQASTYNPDSSNRFMPSVAVDRLGDMAIGYSVSSATVFPSIRYAGRLAGDAANSITQTEASLIAGTGAQTGNCGGSPCERWGDYSAMTLDPNGCSFWYANEYYADLSLNDHTRIGSFRYAGCTDAPPYTQPPGTPTPVPPTPSPVASPTFDSSTPTPVVPTASMVSATAPSDGTPPVVADPALSPNPVIPGATVTVTSTATDAVAVASAQKQLNGGGWTSMAAVDGSFGGTSEALTSTITAPATSGTYSVCVRATDSSSNTSNGLACTTLTVISYSLAPAVGTASVAQGKVAGYTINITRASFPGSITFSATGLPAGATASFTANPSSAASTALSITTSNCGTPTPRGTYVITVIGTFGGLTKSTTVSMTVVNSAPTVTTPSDTLYGNTTLATSTVRVKTAWSACDADGLASYTLQRQVNGGSWTTVSLATATTTSINQSLTKNAAYRFRVLAKDKTGAVAAYAYSSTFKPIVTDSTSSYITWTGAWATATSSVYYGGSARNTSTVSRSASFTFTGSSIAWIAYKSTSRGSAQVYVDGVLRATVNLYSTTSTAKAQVYAFNWATSGSHTIRVVVVGTAGHPRVDVDAFVRLAP